MPDDDRADAYRADEYCADEYWPAEYWSRRLEADLTIRGTGHLSYSEGYNRWLYRAKRRALRRALRHVPPGARILDVGSGVGWVVAELLSQGYAVDGCDIAAVAVEALKAMFPKGSFAVAALGSAPLPHPPATFEAVTLLDVAYHVTDDDAWRAGLADVARVLRPGGRLVVSDGFGSSSRQPAAHVRFRSATEWREAASAAGFELTDLAPYFRWLSRDRDGGAFSHLPDATRGAVEYALERFVPRTPHMRCAVFTKVHGG